MSERDFVNSQASCADDAEPGTLTTEQAEQRITTLVRSVSGSEIVDVRNALDRTLAEDVFSSINVPSHTNSAMDGYALRSSDLPAAGAVATLKVIGTAWAGQPLAGPVDKGQCARIMTGAKMPTATDTVIMQEQVESDRQTIRIGPGHRPGQNVRKAGEDLAVGQLAVPAGKRLTPAELGLFASLGIAEVRVVRRLRVAFFSTGDELRSVGDPLAEGDIYDSNRYTLYGMLRRLNVEIIDMGVVGDQPDAIAAAFQQASAAADVLITTGGVSVGAADFVRETLDRLGSVHFWKLAIKPGRPLAFGSIGNAVFFGLPGNPVAVMVTFYQLVQPALRLMMGQKDLRPARMRVPCLSRLRKKPGRTEFQRGVLKTGDGDRVAVSLSGRQGSGILSSMSAANCFIILPAEAGDVEPGDEVEVEPFDGIV